MLLVVVKETSSHGLGGKLFACRAVSHQISGIIDAHDKDVLTRCQQIADVELERGVAAFVRLACLPLSHTVAW
ncbi:MAG: hypothetical protein U0528_12050 [Anaerolineae bacterium]